jgi:hypothetical protein
MPRRLQHVVERRELRSLIATITEVEEQKAAEAEHAHVTAREELRNRATDRIQELSRTLDDRIMELVRGSACVLGHVYSWPCFGGRRACVARGRFAHKRLASGIKWSTPATSAAIATQLARHMLGLHVHLLATAASTATQRS